MKRIASVLMLLGFSVVSTAAFAQDEGEPETPPEKPAPDRPWAKGVSKEAQSSALQLFEQGNTAFLEKNYRGAMELYRKAIKYWDHPSIRFNMAECLIHLDRPIEAYQAIESALRFGEDPLGREVYDRALTHQKLLKGQLAEVQIECDVVGAQVTLDGERLFTGPGSRKRLVTPGRHQVVASKQGLLTKTDEVVALPSELTTAKIAPVKITELKVTTERRWTAWKPWTIMGAGAAVATVGTVLIVKSFNDIDRFDEQFMEQCAMGCTAENIPKDLDDLESRANVENVVGISMAAVGGATLVLGATLVILNRPRVVEEDPNKGIRVAPVATPRFMGAALEANW